MNTSFSWFLVGCTYAAIGCGEPARFASDASLDHIDANATLQVLDERGNAVTELRYGQAFLLQVRGVVPGAEVRVQSSLAGYAADATFLADSDGNVDTAHDAPIRGSYDGIEAEGLLWSMRSDASTAPSTLDIHFMFTSGAASGETTLRRRWLDQGVTRTNIRMRGLVAQVFAPDHLSIRVPAILVLGGSEGGIESAAFQATFLAGYGFVAMAVAYFAEPGLPADLDAIPLEYFGEPLRQLAMRSDVDAAHITVFGSSRGGELALMLGQTYPNVHAVIAHVPSSLRWGAVRTDSAAWTHNAVALPYLHLLNAGPDVITLPNGVRANKFVGVFNATVNAASTLELSAASIAVEEIAGPVLLLGGGADDLWPSCRFVHAAFERLRAHDHTAMYADEAHCYPDAGHFAPQPGWSTMAPAIAELDGSNLSLGGTARGNAHAQREALTHIVRFLEAQHH